MKVAKRFRWEAAHRLPWHEGLCKNLHGHSYKMLVELEGEADERGMLVDFKDIKAIIAPLVEAWDHAILVHDTDEQLLSIVESTGWRKAVFPFDTTCENMCTYVAEYLAVQHAERMRSLGVVSVVVRIEETETTYAEAMLRVNREA